MLRPLPHIESTLQAAVEQRPSIQRQSSVSFRLLQQALSGHLMPVQRVEQYSILDLAVLLYILLRCTTVHCSSLMQLNHRARSMREALKTRQQFCWS